MFSWLITDRPEAGLTEAKDRHTFFWKCRDDGRESLDINIFFPPLLKKPKVKLSRREPREAADSREQALWDGNSVSFLLSSHCKCLFTCLQLAEGE